jgi:hypothetical protein
MIRFNRGSSTRRLISTIVSGLFYLLDVPVGARVPGPTFQSPQKPTVQVPLKQEVRPAGSLQDLWSQSDVVVEGTIENSAPADLVVQGRSLVYTMFELRLSDVFKGGAPSIQPGGILRVRRLGGLRDKGDHFEDVVPSRYPLFKASEKYVLFMRRGGAEARAQGIYYYETSNGPDSVYRISNDEVSSHSQSDVATALAGQRAIGLRNTLRRLAGGR